MSKQKNKQKKEKKPQVVISLKLGELAIDEGNNCWVWRYGHHNRYYTTLQHFAFEYLEMAIRKRLLAYREKDATLREVAKAAIEEAKELKEALVEYIETRQLLSDDVLMARAAAKRETK